MLEVGTKVKCNSEYAGVYLVGAVGTVLYKPYPGDNYYVVCFPEFDCGTGTDGTHYLMLEQELDDLMWKEEVNET